MNFILITYDISYISDFKHYLYIFSNNTILNIIGKNIDNTEYSKIYNNSCKHFILIKSSVLPSLRTIHNIISYILSMKQIIKNIRYDIHYNMDIKDVLPMELKHYNSPSNLLTYSFKFQEIGYNKIHNVIKLKKG